MSGVGDHKTDAQKRIENLKEERVAYLTDMEKGYPFSAQIAMTLHLKEGAQQSIRPFEENDMERVLDFDTIQNDAPPDGPLMICEPAQNEDGSPGIKFPERQILLRGGFMFVFNKEDVDDKSGPYTVFLSPPLGLIPIDHVQVEFPPGGRRVFREHAHTEANKKGYEFVILHAPPDDAKSAAADDGQNKSPGRQDQEETPKVQRRRAFYLVAHTLGEREKWARSIKLRAKVKKETKMRATYSAGVTRAAKDKGGRANDKKSVSLNDPHAAKDSKEAQDEQDKNKQTDAAKEQDKKAKDGKEAQKILPKRSILADKDKNKKDQQVKGIGDSAEDVIITSAINEFASPDFNEQKWMNDFFEGHNDFDAPARCDQMEHWQASIKKRLKTIVLEQYEYFVQASGEMTTMGREVASLRTLVETQVETIKQMKDIDFSGALLDQQYDPDYQSDDDDLENNHNRTGNQPYRNKNKKSHPHGLLVSDDGSDLSSMGEGSNRGERRRNNQQNGAGADSPDPNQGESLSIPPWLDDCGEEISALMKECRYTAAIDLWQKAKEEISELYDRHYQPVPVFLSKKQLDTLHAILKTLERLANKMGTRLEESSRRKNEALKQAYKRERSDPLAAMAPIVSPCCLEDDAIPLQLLVRLGKTQAAANAYSTRRSLLLLESLHEHPISGAGSVDLVIYSAQLSQSFFSCLATSVEGFLDLFTNQQTLYNGDRSEDLSSASSSYHSIYSRGIPAGSMASIVLWCDAELAKFSTAFGGTRILANLALSPPPRNKAGNTGGASATNGKGPRIVGGSSHHADDVDDDMMNGNRERQNAIEVAAQCVEQAFSCASQNLDSVGLPLTPRLAEYIRARLKGCEAEVAELLDERWTHITLDWREIKLPPNDIPMEDRMGMQ